MITAYWHRKHPDVIDLTEEDTSGWNWIESRPATPEEEKMYERGICAYMIKNIDKVLDIAKKNR